MHSHWRRCHLRRLAAGLVLLLVSVSSPAAAQSPGESGENAGDAPQEESTEEGADRPPESTESHGEEPSGEARAGESTGDDEPEESKEREYPPEAYDPAWARYREAFATLADGDVVAALEKLRALQQKYEGHPAALFAGPVIERLEKRIAAGRDQIEKEVDAAEEAAEKSAKTQGETPPKPGKSDRLGLEEPTTMARAQLAAFQTLHGVGVGVEVCAIAQCVGPRAITGSMVLGGVAGVGLSLGLTTDGITQGHALVLNSGVQWGFWNAAALNSIAGNWGNTPGAVVAPLLGGQLAGLGAGVGLWRLYRPNSGDVALSNAVGLWSGLGSGMLMVMAGVTPTPQALFGTLMATSDLGALAGAFMASKNPMSRGRVYLINVAGLLGGLFGAGSGFVVGGDLPDPRLVSGVTLLGTAGGLALGSFLTRNWEIENRSGTRSSATASMFVRPSPTGRGAVLSVGGPF